MAFEHWLSYSHTDQALLIDESLEPTWNGLVVPGTLAAYYFQGTGGFVLARRRPYIIDPRTPLLQPVTRRLPPKVSQVELAKIHAPELEGIWPEVEIELGYWQDGRWPDAVHRVLDFQEQYTQNAADKIDKYRALLAEAGHALNFDAPLESPARFVPPYFAATNPTDPWWHLSLDAIRTAATRFSPQAVYPIVALQPQVSVGGFGPLLAEMPAGIDTVFCWKGSWQELEATEADIAGWGTVIAQAADRGIRIINLYGGYLSVLLGAARLGGVNHGIGYSESRDVARLSETGAPPTRYYLPALRRFVSRAQAQPLIDLLPAGWRCPCAVCQAHGAGDAPPVLDNYSAEDLKRHFLLCRAAEIARVAADVQVELADLDSKAAWLGANPLPGGLARNFAAPLRTWSSGMRRLI